MQSVPTTSLEVRNRLVEALNLDLIGPGTGHDLASERLPGWVRPSNWYLTGFLIPAGAPPDQSADADEDDNFDEMPASAGLTEESTEERKAAKKGFFRSSMGLSFLVAEDADTVRGTVRWADYGLVSITDADGKAASVWQRQQNERTVPVSVTRADHYRVTENDGLWLHAEVRSIDTAGIAGILAGTRSVSIFLVNRRELDEDNPDLAYAFQAEIEVQGERDFVPRPDLRGAIRRGQGDERPVKQVELEALLRAPEGFGDDVPIDPDFHARRLPDSAWRRSELSTGIASVVQLHRLREVLALIRFTRLEAVMPDIHGEDEATPLLRTSSCADSPIDSGPRTGPVKAGPGSTTTPDLSISTARQACSTPRRLSRTARRSSRRRRTSPTPHSTATSSSVS